MKYKIWIKGGLRQKLGLVATQGGSGRGIQTSVQGPDTQPATLGELDVYRLLLILANLPFLVKLLIYYLGVGFQFGLV